ncbi:MAG: hypothetical protein Q7V63_02430 [Gammaproteobacteria bacterium]|nr:hypothetical protein [Gammaproteobacteria bacterium]
MKRTIRVLGELNNMDSKALLIEMPQDMISGLKIAMDGTVDTKCLLGMLMMMDQEVALEQDNEEPLHEQLDLLLNIYDQSRAVEFNPKTAG